MGNKSKNLAESRKQEKSITVSQSMIYSGPLPPPEILERYESILPGSFERLLSMTEKQAVHRMSIEERVITSKIKDSRLGLVLGFIISVVLLFISAILIYLNKSIEGFCLVITEVVSLAGIFIYSANSNRKEREYKEKQINNK